MNKEIVYRCVDKVVTCLVHFMVLETAINSEIPNRVKYVLVENTKKVSRYIENSDAEFVILALFDVDMDCKGGVAMGVSKLFAEIVNFDIFVERVSEYYDRAISDPDILIYASKKEINNVLKGVDDELRRGCKKD